MSLIESRPKFAVVGHPNKGKSSIVSTLSRNDAIEISQQSGTTTKSSSYKIDTGNAGFELIDTPGFQRPRKVLAWLKQNAKTADQRSKAVEKFVKDETCQNDFPDEVELLKPVVEGAAILYVVDGSRPYGIEYESEMEILRWTGRPSMALINPIENENYVEPWKNALDQFFKIVRVFNPMQADFSKQRALLEAFSHLEPKWKPSIERVIDDLLLEQDAKKYQSAELLSDLLVDLCGYQYHQKVLSQSQANSLKPVLLKSYNDWMKEREQQSFDALFTLFGHTQSELESDDIELPPNLFDSDKWYAWGLDKKQLALVGGTTGAVAGAAVDAFTAGSTLLVGAIGGGALGFVSAWLGADKLVKLNIKGIPLGGYQAVVGPIKNSNFPYVVIGRFIYLYEMLKLKNHADRSSIALDNTNLSDKIKMMQKPQAKELHLACKKLTSQKPVSSLSDNLIELLK